MFADAYELASKFTHPLVVSVRRHGGTVQSSIGTFIVLNRDGWVLTAAHLIAVIATHKTHSEQIAEYEERQATIEMAQPSDRADARRLRELSRTVQPNPEWITNYSLWWGRDGVSQARVIVFPPADLAAARLEPFQPDQIQAYPVLKDPSNLRCGTSLCRLGFPFHSIATTFNEETEDFHLDSSALPAPRFPIEGIYTRNVLAGKPADDLPEVKFLETSSPGLRGQSGGPIFDSKGTVWALQTQTKHLALGFSPKVETQDGGKVEENQFLNVGWGVHPESLIAFLRDNDIAFEISDY